MLKPKVIKIGGAVVADPGALRTLARGIRAWGGPAVVVHGGGPAISRRQRELGFRVETVRGRRRTSPALMTVVRDVLCGPVRALVLAALADEGLPSMGIAGCDGYVEATPVDGGALGRVGAVSRVHAGRLRALVDAGWIPVMAPVSRAPDEGLLNVNADEVAAAVAGALDASELLLVSDVPGVLVDERPVSAVDAPDIVALVASGVAAGGMARKLCSILEADAPKVAVRVGDVGMLSDPAAGTRVGRLRPVAVDV